MMICKKTSLLQKVIKRDSIYEDDRRIYRQTRSPKFKFKQIGMPYHLKMCRRTNEFQHRYHMSKNTFIELQKILIKELENDYNQSCGSIKGNKSITVEMAITAFCNPQNKLSSLK